MDKKEFGKLTRKQLGIFNKLKDFINERGYTPTIREFCKYVDLSSTATIKFYFDALEKKGYIKRINNRQIKIMYEGDYIWE